MTAIRFNSATPQFSVPDLVGTVAYYRDKLGFTVEGYWNCEKVTASPDPASVFAIVSRDAVRVFFNRTDAALRTGRVAGAYDLYFSVDGVDALAEELRRRQVKILDGPADRSYGQREIVIEDCNGLHLTFAEEKKRPVTSGPG
jgi:hypothetical protein